MVSTTSSLTSGRRQRSPDEGTNISVAGPSIGPARSPDRVDGPDDRNGGTPGDVVGDTCGPCGPFFSSRRGPAATPTRSARRSDVGIDALEQGRARAAPSRRSRPAHVADRMASRLLSASDRRLEVHRPARRHSREPSNAIGRRQVARRRRRLLGSALRIALALERVEGHPLFLLRSTRALAIVSRRSRPRAWSVASAALGEVAQQAAHDLAERVLAGRERTQVLGPRDRPMT